MDIQENFINSIDALLHSADQAIPVDLTSKECIKKFLNRYKDVVKHNKIYAEQQNKIDYILMKRFLFTAFNNLAEMDLSIGIGRVQKVYKKLKSVEKEYEDLKRYSKKPIEELFEKIFLQEQISFGLVERDIESTKKVVAMYEERVKNLGNALEVLKADLGGLKEKSEEYNDALLRYKKTNTDYTDVLHELGLLKSKLEQSTYIIYSYKAENMEKFKEAFNVSLDDILDDLVIVLNGFSFSFDQILWEEARESAAIKKFFLSAQIEGSFSSKTYLHYFLKNIDKESKNTEHQRLMELYDYLKSNSSKYILIIGRDVDETSSSKYIVEAIDKDYAVKASNDPDMVMVHYKREPFHLLIIDDDLRSSDCIEVIKEFWSRFENAKRDVSILVRFNNPDYESVIKVGKAGIKNFIFKNAKKEEFAAKVREIL